MSNVVVELINLTILMLKTVMFLRGCLKNSYTITALSKEFS